LVTDATPCSRPLAGLKVHITHIKEFLVPHPTGRTARDLIETQLNELELQTGLGVEFVILAPGDRVCKSQRK
jgi:cAMP phosphodiesterase